jgi:hypothetical protein
MIDHFSLKIFTDTTKHVCMCSSISIIIILLFVISPLHKVFIFSSIMRILAIVILLYTIYLSNQQTNLLRGALSTSTSQQIMSQLNMNILCSYIFTIFIGLLLIFTAKSFV